MQGATAVRNVSRVSITHQWLLAFLELALIFLLALPAPAHKNEAIPRFMKTSLLDEWSQKVNPLFAP